MVQTVTTLSDVYQIYQSLKSSCEAEVQGRSDVIDLILIALLADGHVLLEDHPSSGKTTLAKAIGNCIQRAPDADPRFDGFSLRPICCRRMSPEPRCSIPTEMS